MPLVHLPLAGPSRRRRRAAPPSDDAASAAPYTLLQGDGDEDDDDDDDGTMPESHQRATDDDPDLKLDQSTSKDPAYGEDANLARLVGREELADAVPPHPNYEGIHRWDPAASWTPQEERSVVWLTDFKLLTWICLMFACLQLDRGNLANALTDNLLSDLNLTTDDYNNGTTIQLLAFLTAEFPIQLLTKRLGFRRTLPTMMVMWSSFSWAQAWITNRTTFYITRALIGMCEGGFIPGTILFASYFYKSRELSVRLAFFWSSLNIARVLSSLLAAAILNMRGVAGWAGWRWLFLLEGLVTMVVGISSFFWLPTSPTQTKRGFWKKSWYTDHQEVIMVNRILRDDPAKGLTELHEPATWSDVKAAWSDNSMWGLYFLGLIAYIPQSPVQGYLSLTLRRLGFSRFDSNMLSIPSAILQIILMLGLAKSSEYFNERTFHCMIGEFWSMPLLAALIEMSPGGQNWARYSITSLISGYPYFHPILSAFISENSFDVKKRAITAATYNVIVQMGSVISSQIYRTHDSPYYYQGNKILISICALALVTFLIQRQWLIHLNREKAKVWDRMSASEREVYRGDHKARELDGNRRYDFRFNM